MWLQLVELEMNIGGWIRTTGMPWTPNGLAKWIRNPILRGIVQGQVEGVEPLISPEEWAQTLRLLNRRSRHRGSRVRNRHLFTSLVRCSGCGKALHTITNPTHRLKCMNPACQFYGRGIAVSIVRTQVIRQLRQKCTDMAKAVQQANIAKDQGKSPELIAIESRLAQLNELKTAGVAELDRSIADLQRQIDSFAIATIGPDWRGLAELLALPGALDGATDEELRALILEYIEQIVYVGNCREVAITLRGEPGSNVLDRV